MQQFEENFKYKLIYIFEIADAAHKGLLKIGDATIKTNKILPPNDDELKLAAKNRIDEYTRTAGITYKLLHTELAVKNNSKAFRDFDVHYVLKRSGFKQKSPNNTGGREWFKVNLEDAKKAIAAVKQGKNTIAATATEIPAQIIFRPEQESFIKETVKIFKTENRMLWNAKMRFGKTICALEVVKRSQFQKTLIITHRPVVNAQWFEDFDKIFHDKNNFAYGSKTNSCAAIKILSTSHRCRICAAPKLPAATSIKTLKFLTQIGIA